MPVFPHFKACWLSTLICVHKFSLAKRKYWKFLNDAYSIIYLCYFLDPTLLSIFSVFVLGLIDTSQFLCIILIEFHSKFKFRYEYFQNEYLKVFQSDASLESFNFLVYYFILSNINVKIYMYIIIFEHMNM